MKIIDAKRKQLVERAKNNKYLFQAVSDRYSYSKKAEKEMDKLYEEGINVGNLWLDEDIDIAIMAELKVPEEAKVCVQRLARHEDYSWYTWSWEYRTECFKRAYERYLKIKPEDIESVIYCSYDE